MTLRASRLRTSISPAPPADDEVSGTYDLVIATGKVDATELENIRRSVSAGGRLAIKEVPTGLGDVEIFVEKDGKVAFTKAAAADEALASKEITLVYRNEPASIASTVEEELTKVGFVTKRSRLDSLEAKDGESVIIVGDLEGSPLLATINEKEFEGVKHLTSKASSIFWVTAGGILTGKKPEYAMTNGLARSVTSEQASLALTILDFELETTSVSQLASIVAKTPRGSPRRTTSTRLSTLSPTVLSTSAASLPTGCFNHHCQEHPCSSPLHRGSVLGCCRSTGKITWTADKREHDPLNAGEVEVKLFYGGLNKEDTVVINGNDYPTTFSHEISSTISKVGSGCY